MGDEAELSNVMVEMKVTALEIRGMLVEATLRGQPTLNRGDDTFKLVLPREWMPKLGTYYTVTIREGALKL